MSDVLNFSKFLLPFVFELMWRSEFRQADLQSQRGTDDTIFLQTFSNPKEQKLQQNEHF